MATLAVQIATDLRVLVASKTLIDLTNVRDADTSEDTTVTTKVAEHAAAKVKARLGTSIDGDDTTAVDLGVRLALARLKSVYSARMTSEGMEYIGQIERELDDEAAVRVAAESVAHVVEEDYTDINTKYPATDWDNPDDT